MTLQEIYDRVKAHLLAQGCPAIEEGVCSYRTADGKMCAVGCLITDEAYTPAIETVAVATIMEKAPLIRDVLRQSGIDPSPVMLNFLARLQAVHDGHFRHSGLSWEEHVIDGMNAVARDYQLEA